MYNQQIKLSDLSQIQTIAQNTKEIVQYIQVTADKLTTKVISGSALDVIIKNLKKNNPMFIGESHNGVPFISVNVDQWIEFIPEKRISIPRPSSSGIQIEKGFYTIVYPNQEHRTIQIKEPKQGNFAGKTLVGYMYGTNNETDYKFFGFLNNGRLVFWKNFKESNTPERLRRIERALEIISTKPDEAGKAYALNSGRCYRCNRLLTNPESITLGIGSECRKRGGM